MSSKKKIGIAVIAICIAIITGSFYTIHKQATNENKEIVITIVNDITKETLYDALIQTNAQSLEDLLKEQTQLKAILETSSYGSLLTSLMDEKQDMDKGPWWLYASENNEACVEQGMCPVMQQVLLHDGDEFTFTYTKDIGF